MQRQIDLVAAVGFRTNDQRISVHVPAEARGRVSGILQALGIYEGQPLVLIHAGATAPSRRYPAEGFARVARQLVLNSGCRVLFTGTEPERELIEGIRRLMDAPSSSLLGLNIGEFAALISLADLLLSNNTSAVHIAAGIGIPVVDLYALTNPQHIPWQVPNRVLFHDVPCKYCYSSSCPEGHHDCLRKVTSDEIVQSVIGLLRETGAKENLKEELVLVLS